MPLMLGEVQVEPEEISGLMAGSLAFVYFFSVSGEHQSRWTITHSPQSGSITLGPEQPHAPAKIVADFSSFSMLVDMSGASPLKYGTTENSFKRTHELL
jgi:hypothetical protein